MQEQWFTDNNAYGATAAAINFTPSAGVTVLFSVNGTNMNACAKHLTGNLTYGYDSSTRAYYTIASVNGVVLAACPAATVANDFGGWTLVQ